MKSHKLKVIVVMGTRPEIIRLSRVLCKLDKFVDLVSVYTGQNFSKELSDIFFDDLELRKPDYLLKVKSETVGEQIGNIITQTEKVMIKEKPEALLVLGDTNSALSSIVAKRMKIPIFHMEAGNRCFDEDVPEEINRRIVDHISDFNLAYTEHSRRYLMQEGIHGGSIFVTGSPMAEVLDFYKEKIESANILEKLNLEPKKYFVVSTHREENVDNPIRLKKLMDTLNKLAEIYSLPVVVSLHPRTKNRLDNLNIELSSLIRFNKPFGYFDYVCLQKNACCTLSDSGTIQEESAILNFPAVQIRVSSERPEAFDTGSIILTGLHPENILRAIEVTIAEQKNGLKSRLPFDYHDTNVSSKVLKLILGLANIRNNKRT